MLEQLKFKYYYPKLHHQKMAMLIYVSTVYERVSISDPDFIEYDNKYVYNTYGDYSYWDLADPPVLFLVFLGDKNIPFTTIRKCNEENMDKYYDNIGDWFEIVVENEYPE